MPAIKIKMGEAAVPIEKAITFRDFLTITKDVNKALLLMRNTCLEGRDVVCATYKDQIAHYIRTMLTFSSKGERGPVEGIMRRMGAPEYETVKDIEETWEKALKDYPDVVESEGRAGPEYLEEPVVQRWEKRFAELLGPDQWRRVQDIQRGVMGGESEPESLEAETEVPEETTEAEDSLMRMKNELNAKMEAMLRGEASET